MSKEEFLKKYTKHEDKILVSKLFDKIKSVDTKNIIEHTSFLDGYQSRILEEILNKLHYQNYIFYGGYEEAERKILIIYPQKLEGYIKSNLNKVFSTIVTVLNIKLPNELKDKYKHRDYLGGILKLGVKREKIGDILVEEDSADIIIDKDIEKFLLNEIKNLTRFAKSDVDIKSIENLKSVEIKTEKIEIIVMQERLDSVVAEILKCSRTNANKIIEDERIFINYENIVKSSKILKQGDMLIIRGKGKYKIGEIINNTKKGKLVIEIEKYV